MFKAKIKECFNSIQGEGPYIGYRQLFIRFCGCNLNCSYCDTDFSAGDDCVEFTSGELFNELNNKNLLKDIHSISLTGGEPLLQADFLSEFLPLFNKKIPIYLETNATLYEQISKILDYVDIVSADIKLPSSSGKDLFYMHDKFFEVVKTKDLFAKVIFNKCVTDFEIKQACELAKKYGFELILSPVMFENKSTVSGKFISETLDKALKYYSKVRIIPQVHKMLGID